MKISVVSNGYPISEALRDYVSQRANIALGRYSLHLHSVRASLEDTSNPRLGSEQTCRVEIAGEFGKRTVVVHDRSFKPAIDCALGICSTVVERAINRADSELFAFSSDQRLAS